MAIWLVLLLWAGTTAISALMRPRAPKAKDAVPQLYAEVRVTEGGPIPVLIGQREIKTATLVWEGDRSTTAIVQSGVTTGYKYYDGAQFIFCVGEVEFVALKIGDKSIGAGVTSTTNGMVFAIGAGADSVVTIPPGIYASGGALAHAIEVEMAAGSPGGSWRCGYGFQIVSGANDQIAVKFDSGPTFTSQLRAGTYSGASLAAEVARALTADVGVPGGGTWSAGYSTGGPFEPPIHTFAVATSGGSGFTTWTLLPCSGKFMLGFRHDVNHVSDLLKTVFGDAAVLVRRFIFSYGGTDAVLKATDAGFTAAGLLGISTAADKTFGIVYSDTDWSAIAATFTDQGDFWQIDVNDPAFFGAEEGGIVGRFDLYKGKATQAPSDYLETQFGGAGRAPGYRHVCYGVQRHMYIGNRNTPFAPSLVAGRYPNDLGMAEQKHVVLGDANPACWLYDILNNPVWSVGIAASSIDVAAFQAVGAILYDERIGFSNLYDQRAEAWEFAHDALRHIDGVLWIDPVTALVTLRLARADYVVGDLPSIVEGGNGRGLKISRSSWEETRNVVRIRFIDRDNGYLEGVYQLSDLANIQARGGDVAAEDFEFHGCSNLALAKMIATRTIRVVSEPPTQIGIEVNRTAWDLRPGSPFRLTSVDHGIVDLPCRVTNIDAGDLSGWMKVDAVEDLVE